MPDKSSRHTQYVSLRLARLEELLVAQAPDQLSGRFEDRSGVERILAALHARHPRRLGAIEAKVVVGEPPTPETRRTVDDALKALCRYQDERLGEELLTIRRDGLRALSKACLFLLACMVVSAIFRETKLLPDLLRSLISEGFVIAGWVSLWHPMELLMYEWWPVARDRKLYRLIAEMNYTVEAATTQGIRAA